MRRCCIDDRRVDCVVFSNDCVEIAWLYVNGRVGRRERTSDNEELDERYANRQQWCAVGRCGTGDLLSGSWMCTLLREFEVVHAAIGCQKACGQRAESEASHVGIHGRR